MTAKPYQAPESMPMQVNEPAGVYGVAAAIGSGVESRIAGRHTLEEAKCFINKRFRELYQVSYDAI